MGNQVQANKENEENQSKYHYQTDNGGIVEIQERTNPYNQLGIQENISGPKVIIRKAFKAKATSQRRQDRAMASLAYYMITSRSRQCFKKTGSEFIITNEDIFLLTAIGHTSRVVEMITQDNQLILAQNEHGHIPLYLAARSGFYDLTSILISKDSSINHQQVDGSTALHGAAFYGQTEIVKLLLECGADPVIKNKWNNSPCDEAASIEIKNVFQTYHQDKISKFQEALASKNVYKRFRPVMYVNELIAKEIIINEDTPPDDWIMAWHGTKYKYLPSIAEHGLQPPGTELPNGETIATQKNHYKLGATYYDIKDWAGATFVSPSLRYAAHDAYAERILSEKIRYCVVLKVFFHPSVPHTKHKPTLKKYDRALEESTNPEYRLTNDTPPGEPDAPEYSIPASEDDVIVRINDSSRQNVSESSEFSRNVIVKSIFFIKVDFLDNFNKMISHDPELSYNDIKYIFS